MTEKPILTSARLRLRAVTEQDAAALFSLDADVEVRRYLDQPVPPTLGQIQNEMIPRWQAFDTRTPEVGYWVAEAIDGSGFVGWFLLRPPKQEGSPRSGDLELGYRLRRDRWGQGLATEGGNLLLRYAFDTLHAPRVTATALAAHAASIRVMEKLGMSLEYRWTYNQQTPAVFHAITAEQWRNGVQSANRTKSG